MFRKAKINVDKGPVLVVSSVQKHEQEVLVCNLSTAVFGEKFGKFLEQRLLLQKRLEWGEYL